MNRIKWNLLYSKPHKVIKFNDQKSFKIESLINPIKEFW